MRYRGAQIRAAQVEVLAAVILTRFLEDPKIAPHLTRLLQGLMASPDPENRAAAEQIRDALEQMRQGRSEWRRHRDELTGGGSEVRTSEPLGVGEAASSSSVEVAVPLRVGEVAEKLRISESYVARLCRSGALSATRPRGRRGPWAIDPDSVAKYEAGRPIE